MIAPSPPQRPAEARDFETEWRAIRQRVMAYCRRAAGNTDDAEDVFQQVAIRAWRGYDSFRGAAPFLSWALAIARREIARGMGHRSERGRLETSLEDLVEAAPGALPSTPAPEVGDTGGEGIAAAARAAVTSGDLSAVEATVIQARLADPEPGWDEIGARLGMAGGTCAVTHCRALPRLRVFLFTHRPALLGGPEVIAAAFEGALADPEVPLIADETEAFQRIVLEGQAGYRRAGWRLALRSACAKVVRHLALP